MPRPRETAVSKVNQASMVPSSSLGLALDFPVGRLHISQRFLQHRLDGGRPSSVMMFQVKDTRSRQ